MKMELPDKLHKRYKHISFDLWLTLIKSNPEYKPKRNQLFKDFFAIDKPIYQIAAAIRKMDVFTNSVNEKVGRNFDTFEIYYLILDVLGEDINNHSKQQLEEFYGHSHSLLMEYMPLLLDDSIPAQLKEIYEAGLTMNILSNTAFIKGSSLRHVISHYELDTYFSFQAYSDETGFSKPGVEMYEYAYRNILLTGDIKKKEVLHVGDNIVSDHNGAIAFGFDAHLITNKTNNEYKLQPA